MKKAIFVILLLLLLLMVLSSCGVQNVSCASGSLVGIWADSYGLVEYQFMGDGKMKIGALKLGAFNGTYAVSGSRITIRYRVFTQDVKDIYTIKINGNTMYLDQNRYTRRMEA